jgi:hypothetical protein
MTAIVNIPQGFAGANLPAAFQGVGGSDELSAGVTGGFGIVTFKGKVWRTKFRGEERVMTLEDGRTPRFEIEVVIVKAAPVISKIFYESGFVDGSSSPPDCWSVNGITPDPAASKKQSNTCAGCKQNAWGSKITEAGKQAKACADSKRLAIAPAPDIRNEAFGGPMMLRVPAASLQDMAQFGKEMESRGFPYYAFVTGISFDVNEAYPKFVFRPVRPLSEEEARLVIEQRNNPITQRILEAAVEAVQHDTAPQAEAQPTAASLFTPEAAKVAQAMQAQVQPEPQAQPVVQQTVAPPATVVQTPPARPRFDPMTGQPITYADEQPQAQPVVTNPPSATTVFPDMPSNLQRQPTQQAAQPVVAAKPDPAPAVANTSVVEFDKQLDALLNG